MLRIGQGYDIHRLVEGRPLRLGCVTVESERGALGHSDGDAAAHAICDALLGAAALGDLGTFFPSSDARWRNADSTVFLAHVARLLGEAAATIVNVDVTIVIERPRIAPHIDAMRAAVAAALGVDFTRISVKAKSGDSIGAIGAWQAVEAHAIALIDL
ncbi:MAG TPA: 2-C-methyl-D-erythritol 2,4-cyclodiphosphate synthase [Candidatus Limnocylindrales bacterium]|nr:2-C-methyl-D-erythritol 2,4-cyclodiphosphate synthase [Candidatus Limnocylindrales bacterium]